MVDFTIIMPTHDHAFALKGSINSVLNQTLQSFELYVIGDGQGEDTDKVMHEICELDKRINFLPNKKGEGYGEYYRHDVLCQANSLYVAYLGDDDFWLPNHLEEIKHSLQEHDYTHTITTEYNGSHNIDYRIDDINFPETYRLMKEGNYNFFGLSCTAHRLDSYKNLPYGWRPKKPNIASDYYMFLQWMEFPDITFKTIMKSTTLKLPSRARKNKNKKNRDTEFNFWLKKIQKPQYPELNNTFFEKHKVYRQDLPLNQLLQKCNYYYHTYQLKRANKYITKLKASKQLSHKIEHLSIAISKRRSSILFRILNRITKQTPLGGGFQRMSKTLKQL